MTRSAPISVVIPAFNAARFIRHTIGSVQRQTLPVAEVIVVDDVSTDDTPRIAREMGATVIRHERNRRQAAARNTGIAASKGEWIAFLDADDLWDKRKIELQWDAVNRCPDARLVSCLLRAFPVGVEYLKPDLKKTPGHVSMGRYLSLFTQTDRNLAISSGILPSTMLVRRDVFDRVGVFDESLPSQEDGDMTLRILARFQWALVRRTLLKYRRHESNSTNDWELYERGAMELASKVLKSPADYPAGIDAYFAETSRQIFVQRAQRLR